MRQIPSKAVGIDFGTTPEPVRPVTRLMGRPTTVRVTDEDMSPEQVSARILAEMKRQLEQNVARWRTPDTQWEIDRAIVTAAACYHCWPTRTTNDTFLVHDFGGGTFDVTHSLEYLTADGYAFDLDLDGDTAGATRKAGRIAERLTRIQKVLTRKPGDDYLGTPAEFHR